MESFDKKRRVRELVPATLYRDYAEKTERQFDFAVQENVPSGLELVVLDPQIRTVLRTQTLMIEKLHKIHETVVDASVRHDDSHRQLMRECQKTNELLLQAKQENARLCKLLEERYPVKQMRMIVASTFLACSLAFLSDLLLHITVLHPLLAIVGMVASSSFWAMFQWRAANAK